MKILFTSVGRRVELIQSFRNAADHLNCNLSIIGADCQDTAPALLFCDETIITPYISDPGYVQFLVDCCKEQDVDAVIPTIDTDLLLLSENKDEFGKTNVIISSTDKIKICRDKNRTGQFFNDIGLHYPLPYDDINKYDKGFPAFIKPKDGSSSINAYKVHNMQELEVFTKIVPEYIIQPFIDGIEYTVDAFCDFEGNPIFVTPRIRMAVRSGEVLKTKIFQDDCIIEEVMKIISSFKPNGPITIQLIKDKNTGSNYYIEINPRFGGGSPLSIKAGADSSEALLRLINGEKLSYVPYAAIDGAVYSRFDQSVRIF